MAILAKRLFDYYPAQDVGDPETVLAGIIELFEHYPAEVVVKAVSPVYGIPGKHKFLPRIAEIKEVLDGLMPREQVRVYPTFDALPPPDRSNRPTYAELQDRCARDGLFIGDKRAPRETPAKAAAQFREKFNVPDDVWESIPNAKSNA